MTSISRYPDLWNITLCLWCVALNCDLDNSMHVMSSSKLSLNNSMPIVQISKLSPKIDVLFLCIIGESQLETELFSQVKITLKYILSSFQGIFVK